MKSVRNDLPCLPICNCDHKAEVYRKALCSAPLVHRRSYTGHTTLAAVTAEVHVQSILCG